MGNLTAGLIGAAVGFPLGFRAKLHTITLAASVFQGFIGFGIFAESFSGKMLQGILGALIIVFSVGMILPTVRGILKRHPFSAKAVKWPATLAAASILMAFILDIAPSMSQFIRIIFSLSFLPILAILLPPILMAVVLWRMDKIAAEPVMFGNGLAEERNPEQMDEE